MKPTMSSSMEIPASVRRPRRRDPSYAGFRDSAIAISRSTADAMV